MRALELLNYLGALDDNGNMTEVRCPRGLCPGRGSGCGSCAAAGRRRWCRCGEALRACSLRCALWHSRCCGETGSPSCDSPVARNAKKGSLLSAPLGKECSEEQEHRSPCTPRARLTAAPWHAVRPPAGRASDGGVPPGPAAGQDGRRITRVQVCLWCARVRARAARAAGRGRSAPTLTNTCAR